MQRNPEIPLFSQKLNRARELKRIIDHRKKRDEIWEKALHEYVDLILELAEDFRK